MNAFASQSGIAELRSIQSRMFGSASAGTPTYAVHDATCNMQHATCNMQPHKAVTSVAMQCSATQRWMVGTLPSVGCAPPKPVELDGRSAGGAADGSGRSNIARTSVKHFQKYLCSQSQQTNKQTNKSNKQTTQSTAHHCDELNRALRCAALAV